jgi:hypothetical protein
MTVARCGLLRRAAPHSWRRGSAVEARPVRYPAPGPAVQERDYVIALIGDVVGALDGLAAIEQDMVAQGDLVSVRYRIEPTHSRELFGIPRAVPKLVQSR